MQDQLKKMKMAECNLRVAKGVLKTCCTLKPSGDPAILVYVIDVLEWAHKMDVPTNYPKIFNCLDRLWDETMAAQYDSHRQVKQSAHSFFSETLPYP